MNELKIVSNMLLEGRRWIDGGKRYFEIAEKWFDKLENRLKLHLRKDKGKIDNQYLTSVAAEMEIKEYEILQVEHSLTEMTKYMKTMRLALNKYRNESLKQMKKE